MREETGATPKTVSNWTQLLQLMWCSRRSRIVIRLSWAINMLSAMCIKASHICAKLRGTPKLKLRLHGGIVSISLSMPPGPRNPAVIAMSAWFKQAWMNGKYGADQRSTGVARTSVVCHTCGLRTRCVPVGFHITMT